MVCAIEHMAYGSGYIADRDIRILHIGSRTQDKADARNHGLKDPYVYVVFWAPTVWRGVLGRFPISQVARKARPDQTGIERPG